MRNVKGITLGLEQFRTVSDLDTQNAPRDPRMAARGSRTLFFFFAAQMIHLG